MVYVRNDEEVEPDNVAHLEFRVHLDWSDSLSFETSIQDLESFHLSIPRKIRGLVLARGLDANGFPVYGGRSRFGPFGEHDSVLLLRLVELPPAPPDSLSAKCMPVGWVKLKWADRSTNEDRFIVYRSAGGDEKYHKIGVVRNSPYIDSTVSWSNSYGYRIISANHAGRSEPSFPAIILTPKAPDW
jgi:hypothetical protein